MSVNSTNDSLLQPHLSSVNPALPRFMHCFLNKPSSLICGAYMVTDILLLFPLCVFILYHGLQQWRSKCSSSSASAMSHFDSFTYHMATMELACVFGFVLSCGGICINDVKFALPGVLFGFFTWFGQMYFHVLACGERYLAVVHPITYLSLRQERGVRIRNVAIGCAWLLCFVDTSLMMVDGIFIIMNFSLLISFVTIVSFCSLSVLRVLIRPGPGGNREGVDKSKQRAFYTTVVILGVLVLRFFGNMLWTIFYTFGEHTQCVVLACEIWFNLPSSLVLPLLFLSREGKLKRCKKNIRE